MSAPLGEATGSEREVLAQMASVTPDAVRPATHSADEGCTPALRIAEYAPFPRTSRHQHKQLGFTSDGTGPVLRIAARGREKPGTLLRVVVRGVDGRPQLDTLARVAWCRENDSGQLSLGLAVVDGKDGRVRLVRRLLDERKELMTA